MCLQVTPVACAGLRTSGENTRIMPAQGKFVLIDQNLNDVDLRSCSIGLCC